MSDLFKPDIPEPPDVPVPPPPPEPARTDVTGDADLSVRRRRVAEASRRGRRSLRIPLAGSRSGSSGVSIPGG